MARPWQERQKETVHHSKVVRRGRGEGVVAEPHDKIKMFLFFFEGGVQPLHGKLPNCRVNRVRVESRSTVGGGGGGCHKLVPVMGGDSTKIAPPGTYLTSPLVKRAEFGTSLPTM